MKQQADQEFSAMRRITEILTDLPPPARQRVVGYVVDRVKDLPVEQPQPGLPLTVAVASTPADLAK